MNDSEREMWIDNDEGLYHWWRQSGQSKRKFMRENRTELDECIETAINVPPDGRY